MCCRKCLNPLRWLRDLLVKRKVKIPRKLENTSFVGDDDLKLSGDDESIVNDPDYGTSIELQSVKKVKSKNVIHIHQSVQKGMKKKQYTSNSLIAAVNAVNEGMSISQAGRKFNIPRMTLSDKVNKKTGILPKCSVLTKEEEEILVTRILVDLKQGKRWHSEEICLAVQEYLNAQDPIPHTRFIDNKPGRTWMKGLLKRCPALKLSKGINECGHLANFVIVTEGVDSVNPDSHTGVLEDDVMDQLPPLDTSSEIPNTSLLNQQPSCTNSDSYIEIPNNSLMDHQPPCIQLDTSNVANQQPSCTYPETSFEIPNTSLMDHQPPCTQPDTSPSEIPNICVADHQPNYTVTVTEILSPFDNLPSCNQSDLPSTSTTTAVKQESEKETFMQDGHSIYSWLHVNNVDRLLDHVVRMNPAFLQMCRMKMNSGHVPGPDDHIYRNYMEFYRKVCPCDNLPEPAQWRGASSLQLLSMQHKLVNNIPK